MNLMKRHGSLCQASEHVSHVSHFAALLGICEFLSTDFDPFTTGRAAEEFGVEISADEAEDLNNVGDLGAMIKSRFGPSL